LRYFSAMLKRHKWHHLIMPELRDRCENVVGSVELVQFDVTRHRYGDENKHRAAIAWLHEKRRSEQMTTRSILWIAAATLLATLIGVAATKGWI